MGYLFYKGKQYADEVLVDTTLDEESSNAIANSAVTTALDALDDDKQDSLVSGTNIKTVNNQSILGAGNITVGGSTVSASTSGSSTTEAKYITIDGTEWKLGSGSGDVASFESGVLVFTRSGASQGYIVVTSLAGATVTVGTDSYTYGESETSHQFGPYAYGTYAVTATKTGCDYPGSASVALASPMTSVTCKPTRVPTTYTELTDIQSSGTQYIDTAILAQQNYKYEVCFAVLGQKSYGYIFGNQNGSYLGLRLIDATMQLQELNGSSLIALETIDYNTQYIKTLTASTNGTYSMGLFAGRTGDSQFNYGGIEKIYYFKVYNTSNEVIHNFLPVSRNSDSVVGMYDTVTNTFFTNAGTGTFIPGDPV